MTRNRTTLKALLALAAVLLLAGTGPALADDAVNVSSGLTAAGGPLALHGYDPVAYFAGGQPQRGLAELSVKHEGAVYRFANRKNRAAFERNPERYLPQYGGFCAYGVSVGKKFDGDPEVWKIVDGKLYLNLNPDIQATWEKDVPGNVAKADGQWPRIEDKPAGSL